MSKISGRFLFQGRSHAFVIAATLVALGSVASRAAAQAAESAPTATETASAPADASAAQPLAHGSVFVDPLGLALFGPRLGVEFGAGHFSGAVHARWFNAGLLAHSLFLNEGDAFGFSYGAGVRGRYYLAEGLTGTHFGAAAEYLHSRIENQASLIATNSGYFVPYVEAGYRIPFGGFYADASAGVGYAFQTSAKVEDLPGGSSSNAFRAQDKSSVYGTASLDLGVYF